MLAEERRTHLLELVRARGFASLPDLAGELQVSESTVRRDLEALEESGAAKRTHGGVFYTGSAPQLPHFEEQQPAQWDKKRTIARRAAELVQEGDTILLDGGTTTYEVARMLLGRRLQVVTNSLPLANLLASHAKTDLVLIGGYVYSRTGVALGPYANDMLAKVNVSRTIMSVAGINDRGFYNSNALLVETEQAMMRAADQVVVVADSTKLGRQSLAHLCALDAVDCVVIDDGISPAWRKKFEKAGVELIVASTSDELAKAKA